MPGTHNINIDQGGTFSLTLTVNDSANNNVLASATSAKAQLREFYDANTVLAEMDCSFTSNNQSLIISLDANTTANLSIKNMVWDLRVTWPDKVEYILEGKAKLNYNVTRD